MGVVERKRKSSLALPSSPALKVSSSNARLRATARRRRCSSDNFAPAVVESLEREEVFDEVFVSLVAEEEEDDEEEEVLELAVLVEETEVLPLGERASGIGREETETAKRKGRRGKGGRRFLEEGLLGRRRGGVESWERCMGGSPVRGMVPRSWDLPVPSRAVRSGPWMLWLRMVGGPVAKTEDTRIELGRSRVSVVSVFGGPEIRVPLWKIERGHGWGGK